MKLTFTLIELMVTLAIVAIITIAAIPSMKNYINQGKVSDAITGAAILQTMINKQISKNQTVIGSGNGLTLPSTLGRYVSSFSVNTNGIISITTTNSAASLHLTLTPSFNANTKQSSWACAVSNSQFNNYVPTQCRI